MALVATGAASSVEDYAPNPYADLIIPPQAQREIIDKTAGFVARSGASNEEKLLNNPNLENRERFEFLLPGSPYRAYYDAKLHEFRTGQVQEVRATIPEAIVEMRKREADRKDKQRVKALKAYAERAEEYSDDEIDPTGETIVPPDKERFILKHPYIAPIDSDIIRLTAQFVAKNGQSFLQGLSQRERTNPQFEFLKSAHPAHGYFQALVETYSTCMSPDLDLQLYLQTLAGRRWPIGKEKPTPPTDTDAIRHVIKRMRIRFRWNAEENKKRKAREEAEAEERAAMAAIDWDDFVVVETIVFTEADLQMALPLPVDYEALEAMRPPPTAEGTIPPPQPMAPPAPPIIEPPPVVEPQIPPPRRVEPPRPAITTTTVAGEEQRVMRPGFARRNRRNVGNQMVKCPLTGQMVPLNMADKHLKTVLMDPKYKDQKDQRLARAQLESAFAPEADVQPNLSGIVIRRPDVFGTLEDEVHEHASDPMPVAGGRGGAVSRSGADITVNDPQQQQIGGQQMSQPPPPKKQRTE